MFGYLFFCERMDFNVDGVLEDKIFLNACCNANGYALISGIFGSAPEPEKGSLLLLDFSGGDAWVFGSKSV